MLTPFDATISFTVTGAPRPFSLIGGGLSAHADTESLLVVCYCLIM